MRKADYALLATELRCAIAFAATQKDATTRQENATHYQGRIDALQQLAREFAARASVDKAAFLKACGID